MWTLPQLVLLAVATIACLAVDCRGDTLTPQEETFLQGSRAERRENIRSFLPDEQVDLYLAAMLKRHPPDLALADEVARGGEAVIEPLKQRLATDPSDVVTVYLLYVFARMQELSYYPVASDSGLLVFLEGKVDDIKDAGWRAKGRDFVLRAQSKTPDSEQPGHG